MKTKIKSQLLLYLIILFVFPQIINATIINVPGDQPTIQAGINAGSNGDTVLVQPDTYYQNINFNGKNITVASLFLTTGDTSYISQTIINGGNNNSVVKFNSGESNSAVLSGFTLSNGSAYYGAGINCYSGSSPTLNNLLIIDNHGYTGDSYGGALSIMDNTNVVCSNLTIMNNSANEGGGIFFHNNGNATMSFIEMSNNTSAHGGAMQVSYSSPVIDHSVFYANNSPFGGAVYVFNYSTPEFINCTFSQNEADYGGAFYCSDLGGAPIITNCILWNDESSYNNEIFATSSTYPPVVTYSDVENGTGQSWFGTGCIEGDPLFVDPDNGDFHLTIGSPCINTGDPSSPPDPDGSQADMGAYYFQQLNIEDCEITIPTVIGLQGEFFQLDIITGNVVPNWEVTSFEFNLLFDENILTYLNFSQTGTISQEGDVIVETNTNSIFVSCTSTEFLEGEGVLISLFFNPVSGGTSLLEAYDFYYNTTNISNITNGSAIILGQASDPYPENNAANVETQPTLEWTNGANTETIDLYFGTENPPVTPVLENVPEIEFYELDELEPETTYYWRVDCTNEAGTVNGQVWSFTTGINTNIKLFRSQEKIVLLFPNPACKQVNIRSKFEMKSIRIYNGTSASIFSKKLNKNQINIDVSWLNPGIYFIYLETEMGDFSEKLYIIKK